MKKFKLTILILIILIMIAGAGYGYWCYKLEDDKIWTNYVINEVPIQGMTKEEAEAAVQEKFVKDYQDSKYQVSIIDKEYDLNVFPSLTIDASDVIDEAFVPGHREWYKRGLDHYRLSKSNELVELNIVPVISEPDKVIAQIGETDIDQINTMSETICILNDDHIMIHKGSDGIRADLDGLMSLIEESLSQTVYDTRIECPIIEVNMDNIDLTPFYRQIHTLRVDAILDPKNPLEVLPSQTGVSFDLAQAMADYQNAPANSDLLIPFIYDEPAITTEEMKSRIFRDELSYVEVAGAGSSNRMSNISLASSFCNETILLPGEIFSYNDTVGPRTSERGFLTAGVYSSGQVAQGLGGGICQVSSTIYDAALYADLEIVERRNHSLTVSYLPLGMDATVDYGTQDFRFKNNTKYPIKLLVTYEGGVVKAHIIGTKLDDNTVEIMNESTGGLSCITLRKVFDGQGNLIKEEQVSKSSYMGYH